MHPHYSLIPLCLLRSSTSLFISVCYTGSVEEPQQGENTEISFHWAPTHIKFSFGIGSVLLFIATYDDILIRCLVFPSSPQSQGASSSLNQHIKDRPSTSGQGGQAGRRRHRHHRQTTPSDQPQSTMQQILKPVNLLRRLLPSSSPFNPGSHTSWTHIM